MFDSIVFTLYVCVFSFLSIVDGCQYFFENFIVALLRVHIGVNIIFDISVKSNVYLIHLLTVSINRTLLYCYAHATI